jgi:hypothetical protein
MAGLPTDRAVWGVLFPAFAAGVLQTCSAALAQGATDYPIPSTAREAYSPIGEGFDSPLDPRDDLRGARRYVDPREERLKARRAQRSPNAPVFFRDTDLRANSRTYWFEEDAFGLTEPKAFTTGGSVTYASGYLADFFQLRGALYTTQPLYANATAGAAETLTLDGDQITVLGQLNGRVKFAGQEVTAGRFLVRTPFINPFDVRMIPLTFEGVALMPESADPKVHYMVSYLSHYKRRDESEFISFSNGLGVAQDEGVLITGASYHANGWNVGGSNYWIKDTLNTAYGEIDYLFPFGGNDGLSLRAGVNILDQRTVGADFILGAPYDTYQASARFVTSYQGFVFTGAVSQVGSDASIRKPFGYSTSYTGMLVGGFQQAGVNAYLLSLSYDFAKLGLDGVKFEAAWGRGYGTPDLATNFGFADQEQLNLRLTYEPHDSSLEGLRMEVEYVDWQVFHLPVPSDELSQFRAIVNYDVPLL